MATEGDENERKRQAFIQSLEEARDSLRLHGPASVEDIRRMFDELDGQLDEDERVGTIPDRAHPAR